MKKWYLSKTVWVNLIAMIAMALEVTTGKEILNAEYQGVILTVINLVLRFITSKGITFKDIADVIKPDAGAITAQNIVPAAITPVEPQTAQESATGAPQITVTPIVPNTTK